MTEHPVTGTTAPPPSDPPPPGPAPGGASSFDRLRQLDLRRAPDGWLGGVCAGLAHRIGVDPLVVRAGTIALSFVFGLGVLLYLAAWVLVPDHNNRTHAEEALRRGRIASIVLLIGAVVLGLGVLPWVGDDDGGPFGFGLVALAVTGVIGYALWRAWGDRPDAGAVAHGSFGGYAAAPGPTPVAPPPPPGTVALGVQPAQAPVTAPVTAPIPYPAADGVGPLHPGNLQAAPPAPRRRRRRSGGWPVAMLATGLLIATVAGTIWAYSSLELDGNAVAVALALGLAVLGVILLALGLRGHRAGVLGLLAALTGLTALAVAPLPEDVLVASSFDEGYVVWSPVDQQGPTSYELGTGTAVLDLGGIRPGSFDGDVVSATIAAGELTVLVPDDLDVVIDVEVGVGEVSEDFLAAPGAEPYNRSGVGLAQQHGFGDTPPELTVHAQVGFGRVTLVNP